MSRRGSLWWKGEKVGQSPYDAASFTQHCLGVKPLLMAKVPEGWHTIALLAILYLPHTLAIQLNQISFMQLYGFWRGGSGGGSDARAR